MTIIRNASQHLIAATTALALSLVLISGTVSVPAASGPAAASNVEFMA